MIAGTAENLHFEPEAGDRENTENAVNLFEPKSVSPVMSAHPSTKS